jgi:hypothetical protein
MSDFSAFPALVAAPFGVEQARAANIRIVAQADQMQEFRLAPEPAYFVMVYLDPVDHCDLLINGGKLPVRHYQRGSFCLVDLTEGARIQLMSSLNALGLVIPFRLIEEAKASQRQIASTHLRQRRNEPDTTIYRLGLSILPCFEVDPPIGTPSVRHVIGAICAHLLDEPEPRLQ